MTRERDDRRSDAEPSGAVSERIGTGSRRTVGGRRALGDVPVLRVLVQPRFFGLVAVAAVAITLAITAIVWRPELMNPTLPGHDPWNYLAAAERLAAGHPLYDVLAGDRQIPQYPSVFALPLLATPPTAVLWMPLLVLPPTLAMIGWALGGFIACELTVAWFIVRGGKWTRILVLALAWPLATTAISGNVNAWLVPALAACWLGMKPEGAGERAPTLSRGRLGVAAAGVLSAVAALLRIGPALLGWLFITQARCRSLAWMLGAGSVIGFVTLVVAGPDAILTYLRAAQDGRTIEATPLSIPGILGSVGLDPSIARYSIAGVWVASVLGILALHRHPRAAFALAIASSIVATPVVRFESFALLLPAATPWVVRDAAAEYARGLAQEMTTEGQSG